MSDVSAQRDPMESACALVGRFLYHFGRVEQKIDQAVIKLLDLNEKIAPIVTGSIDFAKKVNFVKTAAWTQAGTQDDRTFAGDVCGKVFKMNDDRLVVAHSSFEPAGGGVQFRRIVSRDGRVSFVAPLWTETNFSEKYAQMTTLESELDRLIQVIKPSEVPFGWFTPWQEVYQRSSSAAVLAATTGTTQVIGPPDQK